MGMELDTAPMMHVDNANQKGSRGFVVGEPGWSLFLAFGANGRAPPVKKVQAAGEVNVPNWSSHVG